MSTHINISAFLPISECSGKTIESVHSCPAEYGRTFDAYTFVLFTDGTRSILGTRPSLPWEPRPSLGDLASLSPSVFTMDELADAKRSEDAQRTREAQDRENQERRQYEALKAKFAKEKP